jgi:hydrogenase nickel incorporation protein HypA/HybF
MHEMSIAQNILEIVPDSLSFCYGVLVEETPYKDSKLIINILPLTACCKECQRSFKVVEYSFICPHCHSTDVSVEKGQELRISHLEVE